MPNDKKTPKTPTEPVRFDDAWNGFKMDYLPFVEWSQHPDDNFAFIIIRFASNAPEPYTNKWAREQFKIKVDQNGEIKYLSAGKRLFIKIKSFCQNENRLPMDLDLVQIDRIGNGFETDYHIRFAEKQK